MHEPLTDHENPRDINFSMERRLVYLVDLSPDFRKDLSEQLTYNGYQILVFNNMAEAVDAADAVYPAIIIAEVVDEDVVMDVAEIQSLSRKTLPIIYISEEKDLETSLKAVRFAGAAFLNKPLNYDRLFSLLSDLTQQKMVDPFRVLILQRDRRYAKYYANILEQARMTVFVEEDPMKALEALENFQPEIILMNLMYPGFLGTELTSVIRQREAFLNLPVIYFTNEDSEVREKMKLRTGEDAIYKHELDADYLVASIRLRVERTRVLEAGKYRDAQTGLLNHSTTFGTLNFWVEKAKHFEQGFTIAMLKIDNFKYINDEYGHNAGDRVVQSLARLLRQRTNLNDVTGRYAGDEFLVLLDDLNIKQSLTHLQSIRKDFARIRHQSSGDDFSVTFSAALVSSDNFETAYNMTEASHRALRSLRKSGGNRIAIVNRKPETAQ